MQEGLDGRGNHRPRKYIQVKGQTGRNALSRELDPKGNCSAGDGVQGSVGANSGSRILRKEYAEDKARGQKSLTRDCVRKRQPLQALGQGVEELGGRSELGLAMTDDLRPSVFEGFFGRDALQPTVVGHALVVREIQTHNQSDMLVIIGFHSAGLFFLRFLCLWFFCLWFLTLRSLATGLRGCNLISFRSVGRRLSRGLLAFSLLVGGGLDFGAFKLK